MSSNKEQKTKMAGDGNKVIQGVLGVILSIIGLLFAFKTGVDNIALFLVYLIIIIVGVILAAKALSSD